MREAAAYHAPLTVMAVHEVAASGWTGNPIILPADEPELEKTRHAAQEAVAKAATGLGETQPASVTVHAVNGCAIPHSHAVHAAEPADVILASQQDQECGASQGH